MPNPYYDEDSLIIYPWMIEAGLTFNLMLTYSALSYRLMREGTTRVKTRDVGERIGLSRASVRKYINELVELGYVVVNAEQTKGGLVCYTFPYCSEMPQPKKGNAVVGDPIDLKAAAFDHWRLPVSVARIPSRKLPASAKALFARLNRYAGVQNRITASQSTLTRELGMTLRSVEILFARFRDLGLVESEQRYSNARNRFVSDLKRLVRLRDLAAGSADSSDKEPTESDEDGTGMSPELKLDTDPEFQALWAAYRGTFGLGVRMYSRQGQPVLFLDQKEGWCFGGDDDDPGTAGITELCRELAYYVSEGDRPVDYMHRPQFPFNDLRMADANEGLYLVLREQAAYHGQHGYSPTKNYYPVLLKFLFRRYLIPQMPASMLAFDYVCAVALREMGFENARRTMSANKQIEVARFLEWQHQYDDRSVSIYGDPHAFVQWFSDEIVGTRGKRERHLTLDFLFDKSIMGQYVSRDPDVYDEADTARKQRRK